LNDAYLRRIMNHFGDKMLADAPADSYLMDYPLNSYEDVLSNPSDINNNEESELMMKEYEDNLSETQPRERLGLGLSLRDQEYLKHSSLFSGHDQSAEGEEDQTSGKPTTTSSAAAAGAAAGLAATTKTTENVLPAYCNPPNPCPVGYTAEDGCLEEFENTAAFSREYQAAQDCMCDTEHMFDCPASSNGNDKNAKNRAANHMVDTAIRKIMSDFQGEHKNLVSKKFFSDKYFDELAQLKERAQKAVAETPVQIKENPFLQGDKLPIAAKKGFNVAA